MTQSAMTEQGFRISPQQKRAWARGGGDVGAGRERVQAIFRLRGAVDAARLHRSLDEVVARREALRTAVRRAEGLAEPLQWISETASVDWREGGAEVPEDGSAWSALRRETALTATGGSWLRAEWSEEEGGGRLLLELPSILADEATLELLGREIAGAYAGEPGAEALEYADVAEVLLELLESEDTQEGRHFWADRAGDGRRLGLPGERGAEAEGPRAAFANVVPGVDSGAGSITGRIAELAAELGTSEESLWLAGWQTLLARLGGQGSVRLAVESGGRTYAEFADVLGPFARTLPITAEVRPAGSFAEHVREAAEAREEAGRYQDYWNASEGALPRYGFSYRDPVQQWTGGGAAWELESSWSGGEHPVLELRVRPHGSGNGDRRVEIRGASVAWEPEALELLLERYLAWMERALEAPEARLRDLAGWRSGEREKVLRDWNATGEAWPETSVVEEIWARSEELPDRVALEAALGADGPGAGALPEHWSYAGLRGWAADVAGRLVASGARRGEPVGLAAERGPGLVAGMLGISWAGCAFLPLDPDQPEERLVSMAADADAERAVVGPGFRLGWKLTEIPVGEGAGAENSAFRPARLVASDLAYVIYTSGSTGRPKGVAVPHRGIGNRVRWMQSAYPVGEGDRVLAKTPCGFDASVWEVWAPLLGGSRVVLARPGGHQEPPYLVSLMAERSVTVAQFVPTLLRWVLEEPGFTACRALRRSFSGGEALTAELKRRFFQRLAEGGMEAELINLYGPTEVSIDATSGRVTRPWPEDAVTIGRPISNARVYVLAGTRPCPVGMSGELVVGGAGLARGYLGRPGWTAERFVPSPFPGQEGGGERLYRTGDRARWLPGGELEYLGRVDRQVKVRGVRVEPGEVEAALESFPGVVEAGVVLHESEDSSAQLAAYYVCVGEGVGEEVDEAELRRHVGELLPSALVPSLWMALPGLPRLPSGKLDRRTLPEPTAVRARVYTPPDTPAEEALAEVWSEVLGVEKVGVEEDFFELGGDSIRSIQVLAAARQRGLDFSVQELFQKRTVRALAAGLGPAAEEALPVETVAPFSLLPAEDRQRIPAEGVEDAYPLTSLQAGMMFHSELDPDAPIYHDQVAMRLRLPLDLRLLREALREVVRRHSVLRSTFHAGAFSEPVQQVRAEAEPGLWVEDLSGLDPADQDAALKLWKEREKRWPFDWTRAPLMRFYIHVRGPEEFNFTVAKHHILTDGWSFATLMTELFALYQALRTGGELPERGAKELDFRHFVALEREAAADETSRGYWEGKLAGVEPLRLPRPVEPAAPGPLRQWDWLVPKDVQGALEKLAAEEGVPIKSVLLAAHLRVLAELSGPDVITGLVSTGRPERPGGERVVGLFLNALPFRQDLSGGTWRQLVASTFENERDLLPHRRYPMARLQQLWGGETLLETDFNFLHYHVFEEVRKQGGMEVLEMDYFEHTNFALSATFGLVNRGTAINLSVAGSPEIWSEEAFERMNGFYRRVLEHMAAGPDRRYEAAWLWSEEERERVLREWNATREPWPEPSVVEEIWTRSEEVPERVALDADRGADGSGSGELPEHWSYAGLRGWASDVAGRLLASGARRGEPVGLSAERGAGLVAGMLGISWAGCAFLPLDPDQPEERLLSMAADAGVRRVMAGAGGDLAWQAETIPVMAASARSASGAENAAFRPARLAASDLAYVIYTSGSTGRPKGVAVPHGGIGNRVRWMQSAYPVGEGDRVLAKTPCGFDASVWEVWAPLLGGSRVVVARPGGHQEPSYLVDLMADRRVTVAQFVPTLLRWVLEEPEFTACRALRRSFSGGEALTAELKRRFFQRLAEGGMEAELINLYGPTEVSIDATACRVIRPWPEAAVTIGRPISNASAFVLNPWGRPCPPGVSGELVVGGAGLARGYLGRPGWTAERFVPSPFPAGTSGGERLYRTGDRARWLPGGELEYLGRLDRQVKVRGVRVEPGEVEAALESFPGVVEAAVVLQAGDERGSQLAAYYVGEGVEEAALRRHAGERLPSALVPSLWMALPALPRLSSGKLDRRALPEPHAAEAAEDSQDPRNPIEEMVAATWCQVLDRPRVGIHEDFFAIGGHSLLATQVVTRLRETFDIQLPLRELFEAPTVASLAERVRRARRDGGEGIPAPPLVPVGRDRPLPLSFAQQRMWFLRQMEGVQQAYNMPTAVRLAGPLVGRALRRALYLLTARHETLRTVFREEEGKPLQIILPPAQPPFPWVDLTVLEPGDAEAEAQELAHREARRCFDLAARPALRLTALRLGPEDHALLLTLHHIVTDGWSAPIFFRELTALYQAEERGEEADLPPLPVQYADFAVWQRAWLQGAALEAQIAYWRGQLEGAPPLLELPTDRPRPEESRRMGDNTSFFWPPLIRDGLVALSRSQGVTLFMTLVAAFGVLLGRLAGSEDVVVGTPVANRTRVETEGLIGFFANTLALRVDLADRPSFTELLERVRETALGAYAHQDLPFEKLVEELSPRRHMGHNPIIQVMIGLQQGQEVEVSAEDGAATLASTPMASRTDASDLDLDVQLNESIYGLQASIDFSAELYDRATIDRWMRYFRRLLEAVVEGPAQPISTLPLLGAEERAQLVSAAPPASGDPAAWGERFAARMAEGVPAGASLVASEAPVALHVLDAAGRPAPLDVAGELCLSAADLAAMGYPDEAAVRGLLPESRPASKEDASGGETLYHTGLTARRRGEGPAARVELIGVQAAEGEGEAARADYEAPRNAVEEVLAGLWSELLGVEKVSIHDSFFALGGHSLLAMQLVARVRDIFQAKLLVRDLFSGLTVAQAAEKIIAAESAPGLAERIAKARLRLRDMSPDDVRKALAARRGGGGEEG